MRSFKDLYLNVVKVDNSDESMTLLDDDTDYKNILTKDVYFKLITNVRKYLIPDYYIIKAITTCTLNKVDTKIFVQEELLI